MRWTLYGPRFLPVRGDVSHPNQGGFDVVIGNPPYVNRRELSYRITGFETDNVDDIYAPAASARRRSRARMAGSA